MKLIELDALIAEIERRITNNILLQQKTEMSDFQKEIQNRIDCLNSIKGYILNTLEVKEVDLDEVFNNEYSKFSNDTDAMDYAFPIDLADYKDFAKHFFELGMRVNNPITAADRGTAEEIIINLKRVEQDYCIDLTKEIEWIRNKVKKGE